MLCKRNKNYTYGIAELLDRWDEAFSLISTDFRPQPSPAIWQQFSDQVFEHISVHRIPEDSCKHDPILSTSGYYVVSLSTPGPGNFDRRDA